MTSTCLPVSHHDVPPVQALPAFADEASRALAREIQALETQVRAQKLAAEEDAAGLRSIQDHTRSTQRAIVALEQKVSGKAEKLKAEKILLDVTRFAEERAGTQLARLRKEQEALAARERIEAKLLQELVVASQRAADHSHALQAQALALERRALVKDREWKQAEADRKALAAQREALQDEVHASESRMAELERQLEDEQKETKASRIALLELDRALAEYEGAHRTCAELGEQNAVERERCDSESERLEAAKRGLEAARLGLQQAQEEEARALSQRQAAEARGRAAERAIELAELARSRAAEAAGRARAEAEVAAGESGAVRAQLASARRELAVASRDFEAAQAAARLAAVEAEAATRAVQRLRAQEQPDEATAPLEEEDPWTALAREQALLRNQQSASRAARLDLQGLAEELAALAREEARLQSENAARAGEAAATKARYAAALERFHMHEALLYRALLDKFRAKSALERERPSRSAERALEAGVRSLEAQLEGARRSLRATSEGASRAKQERGSAQVAKDAEAHAVQAEEALLRTELQSLVALEANLQTAQRRAAGALIRLEIWRLHAHASAQQLLSSEEGLERARGASDEARRAARDRLREAAQRVAQLQAHLAQNQTTLRPLLHELRALQLQVSGLEQRLDLERGRGARGGEASALQRHAAHVQALKEQLAAEQTAERELTLQIEAARQGVAALEDAIAQGQSANQELASQAILESNKQLAESVQVERAAVWNLLEQLREAKDAEESAAAQAAEQSLKRERIQEQLASSAGLLEQRLADRDRAETLLQKQMERASRAFQGLVSVTREGGKTGRSARDQPALQAMEAESKGRTDHPNEAVPGSLQRLVQWHQAISSVEHRAALLRALSCAVADTLLTADAADRGLGLRALLLAMAPWAARRSTPQRRSSSSARSVRTSSASSPAASVQQSPMGSTLGV